MTETGGKIVVSTQPAHEGDVQLGHRVSLHVAAEDHVRPHVRQRRAGLVDVGVVDDPGYLDQGLVGPGRGLGVDEGELTEKANRISSLIQRTQ